MRRRTWMSARRIPDPNHPDVPPDLLGSSRRGASIQIQASGFGSMNAAICLLSRIASFRNAAAVAGSR